VFLDNGSRIPAWLDSWRGDGIISRSFNQKVVDMVRATGIPAVELRAYRANQAIPFVGVDNHLLGKMVAEHFLERGFRHFGCYALDTESFQEERLDAFTERRDSFVTSITQHGFPCDCYQQPDFGDELPAWRTRQEELITWVRKLHKPCGIMANTDRFGFWLLDACRSAGIAVPEEVAVVAVGDDESLCEMATPPMSSVHFPGAKAGYEAAAMLDRLMSGKPVEEKRVYLPPTGISMRASSDIVAVDDKLVAHALRMMRDRVLNRLTVDDIADAVGTSRRTLERRMRDVIGRSPQEEIQRLKLNIAKELLAETNLTMEQVAYRSGILHAPYLVRLFRKCIGMTPGEYRNSIRVPD
jgi:LacI family transcriptional regulator